MRRNCLLEERLPVSRIFVAIVFCLIAACSTTSVVKDASLKPLQEACRARPFLGEETQGRIFLKVTHGQQDFQFPTTLLYEGGKINLEVSNLLGGEILNLQGSETEVTVNSPEYPDLNAHQVTVWRGVPVSWIISLMMGNPVCPAESSWKDARYSADSNAWIVDDGSSKWQFHLEKWNQNVRLQSVIRRDSTNSVELVIEDYDSQGRVRRAVISSKDFKIGWSWRSRSK